MGTINLRINIPREMNWIAVNESGACWAYSKKPRPFGLGCWFGTGKSRAVLLGYVEPPKDWAKTLDSLEWY